LAQFPFASGVFLHHGLPDENAWEGSRKRFPNNLSPLARPPAVTTRRDPLPDPFFLKVLRAELQRGTLAPEDRVLVVCGGPLDAVTLKAAGFSHVTISNLGSHIDAESVKPFSWSHQDAEHLTFEDGQFDVVIVHNGLHHCFNPWLGLGEMCRVARKLVIGFEPFDSAMTRLGARLGYGQEYETSAVFSNDCAYGGVANSEIPNYVLRFSEHELRKLARSIYPHGRPQLRFYKALRINTSRIAKLRNPFLKYSLLPLARILTAVAGIVPLLANNIAFVIQPPGERHVHPWIGFRDGRPTLIKAELEKIYRKAR